MLHLQQLPDHRQFKHGADPAWTNDVGIGGENEMVKPREKRLVFEGLLHEWVDVLLERQLHTNAHGTIAFGSTYGSGPFVGSLHEAGTAARDDVTAHVSQRGCDALDLVVDKSSRLGPC